MEVSVSWLKLKIWKDNYFYISFSQYVWLRWIMESRNWTKLYSLQQFVIYLEVVSSSTFYTVLHLHMTCQHSRVPSLQLELLTYFLDKLIVFKSKETSLRLTTIEFLKYLVLAILTSVENVGIQFLLKNFFTFSLEVSLIVALTVGYCAKFFLDRKYVFGKTKQSWFTISYIYSQPIIINLVK